MPGKVVKPPPFKLRDLHKYSKTLKVSDLDNKWNSLLGGKYFQLPPVIEEPPEAPESPRKEPIDFSRVPAFKQFVLKECEIDALIDISDELDLIKKEKERLLKKDPDY